LIESRDYSLGIAMEIFNDQAVGNKYVVIVITSERSCSGRLNSEVLGAAKDAIAVYIKGNKYVRIVSVGWKGTDSLSRKYKPEICFRLSDLGKPSFFIAYLVMLCAVRLGHDRCAIYFSKYYKIFEQSAAWYEFSSYSIFYDCVYRNRKENLFYEILVSNSDVDMLDLYYYNACLVVLEAFNENKYSELGCRAFAMEKAHRNAIDLMHQKMLIYNKARQAGITNDLLEVVAGAIYTV
jgi:F-type H+-transporting ATPase subunit gamma